MTASAILLLVATAGYAAFQATIRVLIYPQFTAVPADAWAAYERRHQRLVSFVVGPLFVLDGAACLTAFVVGPRPPAGVAGVALIAVLMLTALGAVPQHRGLSTRFEPAAHARLLRVDSARMAAALVGVAAAIWYAAG